MYLQGDVIHGKGYFTYINKNHPLTAGRFIKLKRRICNMKNYISDFIILEVGQEKEGLNFVQFIKNRQMGHEHTFEVQMRITLESNLPPQRKYSKENWKMLSKDMRRKELIALIEQIFIIDKMPDLSDWRDITEDVFGTTPLQDKRKVAKQIVSDYYNEELDKNDGDFLLYEAEKLKEVEGYYGHVLPELANRYKKFGRYEKVRELYSQNASNPWLQKEMGDIEYYGYLNKPDYKKAFKFYSLAAKCGNISAKFMLGQMYKEGLFVQKNFSKYERITRSVYNFVSKEIGEKLLPTIYYVIAEIAYIEKEKGNVLRSLAYAQEAKSMLKYIWKYLGCSVTERERVVAEQINSLTGINKNRLEMLDFLTVLKSPNIILVVINGKTYQIKSFYDSGKIIVEFNGQYYKDGFELLKKAKIKEHRLIEFYDETECIWR